MPEVSDIHTPSVPKASWARTTGLLLTVTLSASGIPAAWAVPSAAETGGVGQALTPTAVAEPRTDAVESEVLVTVTDERITESSGLAVLGDSLITINDSGDKAYVYVIDPATGQTRGRVRFRKGKAKDTEALQVGPGGTVWVADIGDNRRRRDAITLYALDNMPTRGDHEITSRQIELTYPRGAEDAEALLVHPVTGDIFIGTKGIFQGSLYRVPPQALAAGKGKLERVKALPGLITDATFARGGEVAIVRSYEFTFTYAYPSWEFLGRRPTPQQPQGETISEFDGVVIVGSEGKNSAIHTMVPETPWTTSLVNDQPIAGKADPSNTESTPHDNEPAEAVPTASTATTDPIQTPSDEFPDSSWFMTAGATVAKYWPVGLVALVSGLLALGAYFRFRKP